MSNKYVIEKGDAKAIPLEKSNLFMNEITDMEDLEYWESRLDRLGQPYVVAFKKSKGKIVYAIFTNTTSKESKFK